MSSLIAIMVITNLNAQQKTPKLVVCITVDQLRGDYVEYFWNTFGEQGFKRLMKNGLVYSNVRFDFNNIEQASAFATIFTGSNPSMNAITGDCVYDFDKERETPILTDPDYLGNYTQDHFSPKKLMGSTIGDELKIASGGSCDVYSIAPDAQSAILSAGHAANGAFWMDDYNGKWATTTYYKDVPWFVEKYNNGSESLTTRQDKIVWTPSLPINSYNGLPYITNFSPFKYTFKQNTRDGILNLKTSPYINKEVNNFALKFIEYAGFGTRKNPDLLCLTYYAGTFRGNKNSEYTHEIQDTYYQLDKDIEQLLGAIDKKVGLANTMIVFCGSGYFRTEEEYPEKLQLGGGEFHPKRCIALLNMYLMAIYGQQSNWVKGYYKNQIFLDRKAIEKAKLDLGSVQEKAAEFLREFSGIQEVTTDNMLRTIGWNNRTNRFLESTNIATRGDIIIELQPGWKINFDNPKVKDNVVRNNAVLNPLIFFGNGIKAQRVFREVNATDIAPTVTHVLRIRPPNASTRMPLQELSF